MPKRVKRVRNMGQADSDRRSHGAAARNRLAEYLVRVGARAATPQSARSIAQDLGVPYSSVTAQLRRLVTDGLAHQRFIVNPFRTRFCHEFRIGLRLDAHRITAERAEALASNGSSTHPRARSFQGAIEWYLSRLIDEVTKHSELADHLIVTDAIILHGAPGRDVELTVFTDDGIYSAGRYVREVLVADPRVLDAITQTVAWRYRFGEYSGHHANGGASSGGVEGVEV